MFRAAAQLILEAKLSRMLRWEGMENSRVFPRVPHLFLNTHPTELIEPGLVESMRTLRSTHREQPITLEIHEAAVMNERVMTELRAALKDLQISLAYDDFGAGQARLRELVEVRPDYLKFDIALTRGIHQASAQRQQLLATLVGMARELDIVPLAEGIESDEESQACHQLGFVLGQGYRFGKPEPASYFAGLTA
jgi:EAL domain-containing protein (putative c-di-GMP-specific phosphodiesterase class I)